MDSKPFLANLHSLANSTKRIYQNGFTCPTSCTTSNPDTDDTDLHGKEDRSTATLAQIIAATVSSTLNATKYADTSPSPFPEANTQFLDMDICLSPLTSLKMDVGHIQVACTACGTSVEARHKICNCSCVAILPKLLPMDFSKLATHCASEDLGMMALMQQMMLDKFWTLCQQVDEAYIFQVLYVHDLHDNRAVVSLQCVNLLIHYKSLQLASVLKYQVYINEWQSDIDVESCDSALQFLEFSMTPTLLV